MLFSLTSCNTQKTSSIDYSLYESAYGMKGTEIYCWEISNNDWRCGALIGTNRNKTNDEIKRLYPIKLEDMKELLEKKDLIDCSSIILIYINDGDVEFLNVENHFEEYEFLYNYFGI